MARDTLIHELHDRKDVRRTYKEIRDVLDKARSREDLSELYKQTVYMILMTHSSPLNDDRELKKRRETAEREFGRTVRQINRQAEKLGVEGGFSEDWQNLAINGYETEDENLLEPPDAARTTEE